MGTTRRPIAYLSPAHAPAPAESIVVRAVSSPDEAQIFRTVGAVVDELYPDGREKLMAKLLTNMALGDHSFVVCEGDKIVAYAAEAPKADARVKLSTFWVHEGFRRRGIGRLLIEFLVVRWAQSGVASVHVTVRAGRDVALFSLLSQYGFTRVALVRDRYGRGRDEAVLAWTPLTWSESQAYPYLSGVAQDR